MVKKTNNAEQGELLRINGISYPAIVVSNDFFNSSGKAVVCPVVKDAAAGPLHIHIDASPVSGYVLCEQLRYLDLDARRFTKISSVSLYEIMDISDAVKGMFDYQMM